MQTFFVQFATPAKRLNGHVSYGTHVSTDTPEAAAAVVSRLGDEPGTVSTCTDIFTCTHSHKEN